MDSLSPPCPVCPTSEVPGTCSIPTASRTCSPGPPEALLSTQHGYSCSPHLPHSLTFPHSLSPHFCLHFLFVSLQARTTKCNDLIGSSAGSRYLPPKAVCPIKSWHHGHLSHCWNCEASTPPGVCQSPPFLTSSRRWGWGGSDRIRPKYQGCVRNSA